MEFSYCSYHEEVQVEAVHHDVVQFHQFLQIAAVPAVYVAELDQALVLAFRIVQVETEFVSSVVALVEP